MFPSIEKKKKKRDSADVTEDISALDPRGSWVGSLVRIHGIEQHDFPFMLQSQEDGFKASK